MASPKTFKELFTFYDNYVKILYGAIQAQNELPQETLFEINAAFDHIARHWTHGRSEEHEVEKAYSHLKRSCLDIFKLMLKDTMDRYKELCTCDTGIIDNGNFDTQMHQLITDIRKRSIEARKTESADHDDDTVSFAPWVEVYKMCVRFNEEFFLNPHIEWARKKNRLLTWKTFYFSVAASFVAGLLFIKPFWDFLCKAWVSLTGK